MAKLPNRLVIEITNTDKVDELGYPVIDFESKDYSECVIEELEKIKEKIEEHNRKYLSDDNAGLERAIWDFIEPRISELKGENK